VTLRKLATTGKATDVGALEAECTTHGKPEIELAI
jgi:hypothetical protein